MLKRILTTLLLLVLSSVSVMSQTAGQSGLTITSNPPGAEVILEGDAMVTGVTPTAFRYPLIGEYKVVVRKHGYEDYKSRLVLDPSKEFSLDVNLSRKTGIKAAVRSMFIPGWGQHYTDQNTKSLLFAGLFAGAAAFYFIADHDFDDKEDDFVRARGEYDEAVKRAAGDTELRGLLQTLTSAQQDAYDSENVRRVAIGTVIGAWGLNILDALLFTPGDEALYTVKGISVVPEVGADGVGLTLSKAF